MIRTLCLAFLLLALTACSGDDDSPRVDSTPTETETLAATLQATPVPTTTPTLTPTASPTYTPSPTPTITPTLAVRVMQITAVMPGVISFAPDDAVPDALPLDEWVRLESDHPNLEYVSGEWIDMWSWSAGQNEYRYSVDPDAAVRLEVLYSKLSDNSEVCRRSCRPRLESSVGAGKRSDGSNRQILPLDFAQFAQIWRTGQR